ncbi:MAG: GlsB/YeaQ/YmgE family stress response membrane protein [Natronosporangium sp.]
MGVVAWIVLGAVAGLIADRVTGSRAGLLLATVIGIAGALVGGFVAAQLFGVESLDTFFDLSTWVTAILGAVGLFLLFGAVRGRSRRSRRAKSWLGSRR